MDDEAPLREDVKLLGRLLGETLAEHHGKKALDRIENIRTRARTARHKGNDPAALNLAKLSDEESLFVARSFAHFLALSNIAEQNQRVRRFNQREDEAESLRATVKRLCSKLGKDVVHDSLAKQVIELVLTAHPTEVSRRTILHKLNRVAALLETRPRTMEADLRREIEALWLTDEIRRRGPTPEDEARGGWVVVEQSVWSALPRFWRALDTVLLEETGRGLPADAVPIRFASWMGGDRDGNPNVTAEVSQRVCLLARWLAADLYLRDVEQLRDELSMSACTDELRERVGKAQEPYRELLGHLREKLKSARSTIEAALKDGAVPPLLTTDDILEPLLLCERSLRAGKAEHIASGSLLDTIRRVRCFGAGFLRLDLRQESTRHTQALAEVLAKPELETLSEADRQALYLRLLQGPQLDVPSVGADAKEVLDTFRVAAQMGAESIGAYVISMTRQASDILAVALLQKICGVTPAMRIVPLFETITDLEASERALAQLFALPWYRELCSGKQEVMIGYSDSAKDRGRLMAAFALYEAQERITKLCKEQAIELTFFHGRGGSVGRGGGSTRLAIASQAAGTVQGRLRVTEQGEMIQAKLALPAVAFRTFEMYCEATLEATLEAPGPPKPEWREMARTVCTKAAEAYEAMVKRNKDFIPYFKEATPIDELSLLNIGSRPARRKALSGVEGLRAIGWVFSWTQTRLHLPVWLGLAEGFAAGDVNTLRQMYSDWPFFHAVLDLIAMVLAKTELDIAEHYDELLADPSRRALGASLRDQVKQATAALLSVTQQSSLLADNTSLARAIDVRNPYIDPLNLLQAELLRRMRAAEPSDTLRDAMLITVNGIANGMRNTG